MIVQVPLRHVKHDLCTRRGSVCLVVRREPPDHDSCSTASRSVSASVVNLRRWSGLISNYEQRDVLSSIARWTIAICA
jgi:hypothetical protein